MNWSENNVMKRLLKEKILKFWEARPMELSCFSLLLSFVRSRRPCCRAYETLQYRLCDSSGCRDCCVNANTLLTYTHATRKLGGGSKTVWLYQNYTEWSRIRRNGPSRKRVVLPLLWLLELVWADSRFERLFCDLDKGPMSQNTSFLS